MDKKVVVDRGLVTSRTPDEILGFCVKLVEGFAEGEHPEHPVAPDCFDQAFDDGRRPVDPRGAFCFVVAGGSGTSVLWNRLDDGGFLIGGVQKQQH